MFKTLAITLSVLLATPVVAQDPTAMARNLMTSFESMCLSDTPNAANIRSWEDRHDLEVLNDDVLGFYKLVYDLEVTNGSAYSYTTQSAIDPRREVHVAFYNQWNRRNIGCVLGSPDVDGKVVEQLIFQRYGLAKKPKIDKEIGGLRHRMWNFGDDSQPQYFVFMKSLSGSNAAVLGHFGFEQF